jgi:hypothetical protein
VGRAGFGRKKAKRRTGRTGKMFSGLREIRPGQIERILILKDLFYLNFRFESRYTSSSMRFRGVCLQLFIIFY